MKEGHLMKHGSRALRAITGWGLGLGLGLGAALGLVAVAAEPGWRDVLDTPALQSARASRSLFNGLARAGDRIVAVGQRGQILYSDNGGRDWKQAAVPLAADLVAVAFPTATQGWAVGHGGVILHTADAGATWTRQFDGRRLGEVMAQAYALGAAPADAASAPAPAAAPASAADATAAQVLDDAKRFAAQGPEASLLDVWFRNETTGWAVGAFGLILQTTDGGAHWTPLLHAVDNPKGLHLYAVRGVGDDVYLAGEQGLLLKLDRQQARFRAIELPYKGTLFGILGNERAVILHGLRGTVLRSADGGATWQTIPTGVQVGLPSGTQDAQGRFVLVSQAGQILVGHDDGASFTLAPIRQGVPAAGLIATARGPLVVAGPRGVSSLELP
jgi:photosystem II stability/assembly factor-like uncharacterized protein